MNQRCGIVGLGRIGVRVGARLIEHGFGVDGFDIDPKRLAEFQKFGGRAVLSAADLLRDEPGPRKILLFLPAGGVIDETIDVMLPSLQSGDIVMDFGNSYYADSIRRGEALSQQGLSFLDVGISGGVSGARNGACLTIGGERSVVADVESIFQAVAQPGGYLHVGPQGWGHLVKTVHNGIEYGFLQAIGEGLHTIAMTAGKQGIEVDLLALARVWNHGSIIQSRLLADTELALEFLRDHAPSGTIGGGQTGRWALQIAREAGVTAPALEAALAKRAESEEKPDLTGRIIAAIRQVFGEHPIDG